MFLGCPLPIHIPEPEPACVCVRVRVRPCMRGTLYRSQTDVGIGSGLALCALHIPEPEPACVRVRVRPRMWALHPGPEPMLVLVLVRPCVRQRLPVLPYIRTRNRLTFGLD